MKITAKSRYALRVLLDLAVSGAKGPRTIKEIASSQGISEKFISRIAVPLRRAGLVTTERGVKGGLRLARFPARSSAVISRFSFMPAATSVWCSSNSFFMYSQGAFIFVFLFF